MTQSLNELLLFLAQFPLWLRILIILLLGALLVVAPEFAAKPAKSGSSTSSAVTSSGQHGGITAGSVTIHNHGSDPSPFGENTRRLGKLTDEALRRAVDDYARKIRTFEANSGWPLSTNVDREARYVQVKLQFDNDFLPHLQALHEELKVRLNERGIFAPYVEDPFLYLAPKIIDSGAPLAGPQPLSAVATYLQTLARRLPG